MWMNDKLLCKIHEWYEIKIGDWLPRKKRKKKHFFWLLFYLFLKISFLVNLIKYRYTA